jgi:propanol-preferring alcohol dehydrogenase
MIAMVLNSLTNLEANSEPLVLTSLPDPVPGDYEVLLKVTACGICHTELDEIEGRIPPPELPVVLGHQVVGIVQASGRKVRNLKKGDRLGVAWIFSSCGKCDYCLEGNENLCSGFRATGRDAHGGYAEYMTVPEDSAFRIPDVFTDVEAAPLLCAGAIGYRSLKLTNLKNGQNLGLTGFGASAHLVLKMARHRYPNTKIYVFARSEKERAFATELGAVWAGDSEDLPPELLDCIIDTTPVWKPVVEAMKCLKQIGRAHV